MHQFYRGIHSGERIKIALGPDCRHAPACANLRVRAGSVCEIDVKDIIEMLILARVSQSNQIRTKPVWLAAKAGNRIFSLRS